MKMQNQEINIFTDPVLRQKDLRLAYQVTRPTWKKWLNMVPDINLRYRQRHLNRSEIDQIIKHLGEP